MKIYLSRLLIARCLATVLLLSLSIQGEAQAGGLPPYALRGPYTVGSMETHIEDQDGADRSYPITIWYPALNPDGIEETIQYPAPTTRLESYPGLGQAIQNGEPDIENGPYPLVIFSHGLGSSRLQSTFLSEHLASYGFVVFSADHADHIGSGNATWFASFISRPVDVVQQITLADSLTAEGGTMHGLIDTERIAVTGHSFGGYTALAAAGGRMDPGAFVQWCLANRALPDPIGICPQVAYHQDQLATLAGLDDLSGPLPAIYDPRVDAAVPLAPMAGVFGPDGLADIDIPVMLLAGSADVLLYPEGNFYLPFVQLSSIRKAFVEFENASHMIFLGDCDSSPWIQRTWGSFGCSDPVWDMDQARDLINHFTTAFLLAELYGDADAVTALAPDAVQFPGIGYATTGY